MYKRQAKGQVESHSISTQESTLFLQRSAASINVFCHGLYARPAAAPLTADEYHLYTSLGRAVRYGTQAVLPSDEGLGDLGHQRMDRTYSQMSLTEPGLVNRWRQAIVRNMAQLGRREFTFRLLTTASPPEVPSRNPHEYWPSNPAIMALQLMYATLPLPFSPIRVEGVSAGSAGALGPWLAANWAPWLACPPRVESVVLAAPALNPSLLLSLARRSQRETRVYLYIAEGDELCPVDVPLLYRDLALLREQQSVDNIFPIVFSGHPREMEAVLGRNKHNVLGYARSLVAALTGTTASARQLAE